MTSLCPNFSARPPPLPLTLIGALMLTFLQAESVSVFAADQVTLSLTLMSPLTLEVPVPQVAPVHETFVLPVAIVTLVLPSAVESAAPVMSPFEAAMVKSNGSSSHCPVFPLAAPVSILAVPAIPSLWPLVSMKPPSPDWVPPFALIAPETSVRLAGLSSAATRATEPPRPFAPASALMLPLCSIVWLAVRRTVPPSLVMPLASMLPLLTTRPNSSLADCAESTTSPSPARTSRLFSTSVSMFALSTRMSMSLSPVIPRFTASPAARATVPMRAAITPSFLTSGASSATYFAMMSPWFTTLPVAPSRVKR